MKTLSFCLDAYIGLHFTFMSMIHFKLILTYCVRVKSNFFKNVIIQTLTYKVSLLYLVKGLCCLADFVVGFLSRPSSVGTPTSLLSCHIAALILAPKPRFLARCPLHHQRMLLLVTACCLGEPLRPCLYT